MYMTLEDRKKLQTVLENALCDVDSESVQLNGIALKEVCILLLSLIYELNAKTMPAHSDTNEERCFCQRLHELLGNFSTLKAPDIFGQEYLRRFTRLANSLGSLSAQVNNLLGLLHRGYAEQRLKIPSDGITLQ